MFSPINFRFTRGQYVRILDWQNVQKIGHTGTALKSLLFEKSALPKFKGILPSSAQVQTLLTAYQSKASVFDASLYLLHAGKAAPQSLFDAALLICSAQRAFSDEWSYSSQMESSSLTIRWSFPLAGRYFHDPSERYSHSIPIRVSFQERAWLDYVSASLGGVSYSWIARYSLFGDKTEQLRKVRRTRSEVERLLSQSIKHKNILLQALSWLQVHGTKPPTEFFQAFVLTQWICERLEAALSGRKPLQYDDIAKQVRHEKLLLCANTLPEASRIAIKDDQVAALVAQDKAECGSLQTEGRTFRGGLDLLLYFQSRDHHF